MTPAEFYALNVGESVLDTSGAVGIINTVRRFRSPDSFVGLRWTTRSSDSTLDSADSIIPKIQPAGPATGTLSVWVDEGVFPAVDKKGFLRAFHYDDQGQPVGLVTPGTVWNSTSPGTATVTPGNQINFVGSPGPVDFQGNYRGLTSTTSMAWVWPLPEQSPFIDGQTFEVYGPNFNEEYPICIVGNSSGTKRGKITLVTDNETIVAEFDLATVEGTLSNMLDALNVAQPGNWAILQKGPNWFTMAPPGTPLRSVTIEEVLP